MALPYRPNYQRKYRCFICGMDYIDYDEFKDHVTGEHEEGREYVVCKLCQAPVRDMRLHYKTKHPGKKLQDGQRRAQIWYDFSGQKRTKMKKPAYVEGTHISPKNNWQEMHYRSSYELEVYKCLDELKEIMNYEVEPRDCVTPYFWNGKWRKYWPDLKVRFIDGHTEIWEVKPSNQTDYNQNRAKWDACSESMGNRGWSFWVKTEMGINKLRKLIVEQHKQK